MQVPSLVDALEPHVKPLDAVPLVALVYHTINHTEKHAEGEQYTSSDPAVVSTVLGCGFAALATPAAAQGAPPTAPPPELAVPHGRTHR